MKLSKKTSVPACVLALTMLLTGCDETSPEPSGNPDDPTATTTNAAVTTTDPDENAATDKEVGPVHSDDFTPDGNAGTIRFLCHYDVNGSDQALVFNSEQYGGTIEYINSPFGDEYFLKLSTMIAADDSPDVTLYMWQSCPGGISKGMYLPLDEYIDLDTSLWKDMKGIADDFAYKGKHYYYPFTVKTNFALNYNRNTINENNLPDPYQLYKQGEWTWDTFKSMMLDFCAISSDNVGYCSTGDVLSALALSSGTPIVDVKPDGTIVNNLNDPAISRVMAFISDLNTSGVMHAGQYGDWVSPQVYAAKYSDKILFLGMEPEWCYTAATETVQNPKGIENDIHDVISDFAFVPFPRDPNSDTYYSAFDTFGYLVVKGAKNVKGAIDWIQCNRVYETDANVIQERKDAFCHPKPITFIDGKYAGERKWTMTWDEQLYDLWMDMKDPSKFSLVFDDVYGFNSSLSNLVGGTIYQEVGFHGGSFAQIAAENAPVIDALLDEYR